MESIEAKVSVTQLPEMRDFFEVLAENIDQLPPAVADALNVLCGGDALVWDIEWMHSNGHDSLSAKVFADGKQIESVASMRPIRKVIVAYDDNHQSYEMKAEHAQLVRKDGYVLREW